MAKHPYSDLPAKAFWKKAVASRHFLDLEDISAPIPLNMSDRVATAGSCFAQHIGRHLKARGANYLELERAPPGFDEATARDHGYSLFSCRYGNVYTARQMLQLAEEAFGNRQPENIVWEKEGRFFDALRPSVDPSGHSSAERIVQLRSRHLAAVREMIDTLDVLVFTLGLTEAWESQADGTVYPTCPGTVAGEFDPTAHRFRNFRYADVSDDLQNFWAFVKRRNKDARLVLTVSPVPLTATASGEHVLTATTQSKATLRAVAGDFASDHEDVSYFPSYEIISTHPGRGMFFNPDMRSVNDAGVQFVMKHFFECIGAAENGASSAPMEPICEESKLDQFESS